MAEWTTRLDGSPASLARLAAPLRRERDAGDVIDRPVKPSVCRLSEEHMTQKDIQPEAGAGAHETAVISRSDFCWKRAGTAENARPMALDHSLAFHRLQEAREELHRARTGFPTLTAGERAQLVAYCEASLAKAEQWVVRASAPVLMISPPASP